MVESDSKVQPLWPDWLTREQFARKHGVSVRTLYRWIHAGDVEVKKTEDGKRYRVKEVSIVGGDTPETLTDTNAYLGDIVGQLTEIASHLGTLANDSGSIAQVMADVDVGAFVDAVIALRREADRAVEVPHAVSASVDEPEQGQSEAKPKTLLEQRFPSEPELVAEVEALMRELTQGDLYSPRHLESPKSDGLSKDTALRQHRRGSGSSPTPETSGRHGDGQ